MYDVFLNENFSKVIDIFTILPMSFIISLIIHAPSSHVCCYKRKGDVFRPLLIYEVSVILAKHNLLSIAIQKVLAHFLPLIRINLC